MKKINLFLALLCVAQIIFAEVQPSVTLTDYYSTVNNKSGDAIRTALYNKINSHTTVSYDNLKYLFKWTDTYNNAGTTIDDIYSFCDPAYTESWCSGICGYNREHSVPKSWFNEASPLYSDAFHLYPTNCYVNSYRGNEPFGECADGTKCTTNGVNARGRKGTSTFSDGGTSYASVGTVYEPDDEFKGDLARTYFYMVTCYMNNRFNYADGGIDMFTWQNSKADLSAYSIALLLKWHRQDPVSERELARNEVIYGNQDLNKCSYSQGNRNPFIDYPELAEYIWGNRKGQTVDLANLISPYSGDTLPIVPPIPAAMYGVTWSANGEVLYVDSIAELTPIQVLPAEPTSCSSESDTFVGWTTAPISGTSDEAPVLYKEPADFPVVSEDVTYYAVFAKAETSGSSAPAVYTFNAENQNGWLNTATSKGSYWLLESGKTIVSPEVDLMGLGSITVRMRTYGGSGYNQLTISEADGVLTTMTATAGSTMTEYTWDNNLYIAGTSALTFSSDYGSNKGIGIQSIIINATGSSTSYSRYITTCQDTTEVETVLDNNRVARKVLIGGHVYILLDNQLFNLQGQLIK